MYFVNDGPDVNFQTNYWRTGKVISQGECIIILVLSIVIYKLINSVSKKSLRGFRNYLTIQGYRLV